MQETIIKRLETLTLADALKRMDVGEVRMAPEGYSPVTVIRICCELKREGFKFRTSRRMGEQLILRVR